MVSSGLPFRQANSEALRLLLCSVAGKEIEAPNAKLVRAALYWVYRVCVDVMESRLHKSPSFSVLFDGWTGRNVADAYVAVIYTFLDKKFKVSHARFQNGLLIYLLASTLYVGFDSSSKYASHCCESGSRYRFSHRSPHTPGPIFVRRHN